MSVCVCVGFGGDGGVFSSSSFGGSVGGGGVVWGGMMVGVWWLVVCGRFFMIHKRYIGGSVESRRVE